MTVIMRNFYIYIITNKNNTTLYTGVTNNLLTRVDQHKKKTNKKSFTSRYNIDKLVYYEVFDDSYNAIVREKQIKAGSREKKLNLINSMNPEWRDLFDELCEW